MSDWINVAKVEEFLPGAFRCVMLKNNRTALVCNVDNEFYAIENICSHDGGTLSDGELEKDEIVCPRHGAHFCVRNGFVMSPPAYKNIGTFATRTLDGMVQVCDELRE